MKHIIIHAERLTAILAVAGTVALLASQGDDFPAGKWAAICSAWLACIWMRAARVKS